MSNDVHDQILINKPRDFVCYSIALNSRKDITGTEQLAVLINGVMPDFKICEGFLTLCSFHGSTKWIDMFRVFRGYSSESTFGSVSCFQWKRMGVLS